MTIFDWMVIAGYFAGLVVLAFVFGRGHHNLSDYYLAGRKIRWWQSGLSTMATQLGAISFVSAPAFVALKENGGLKWLCYEFGVPLGILFVIIWIIPRLHQGRYVSIYEYLEQRFDRSTRALVSMLFQLGRALATAVSVLAGGLILSTALPLSTSEAILLIGAVTVIYDALGGMKIVIISDVFQMSIIFAGILICGIAALSLAGWGNAWGALSPDRLRILDFSRWGTSSGGEYAFWPMTIGGIFLYASYYGCDQSQVQRELSVGTIRNVKRSLLFNAFSRFPIVLLYCLMGVFIGAVFANPEHVSSMAAQLDTDIKGIMNVLQDDPDRMVPMFILAFLPAGVVGLIFVSIMSALMSSLDSAINSLSAVTMQDFYRTYFKPRASERHYLIVSKGLTVFWGAFCVLVALNFAHAAEATRQTTIVLINAVGSLLYGPVLAAFFIGMATRSVSPIQVKVGVITGIIVNIGLWRLTDISWLWWNFIGFMVVFVIAVGLHSLRAFWGSYRRGVVLFRPSFGYAGRIESTYVSVIMFFFLIILFSYLIQSIV
ncbi:MAG: sodium/solute symporter [Candidatus Latescibacteria bacterium]|nr:sodium/solute symporter [Candidatus Latescibacterota bacterium]NIM64422.1 sodium/solute symporter [Candidatus Latescibacterota bacterium]NIO00576.1 sodium/solute symporter [Candidatus Latescibacterota bacterium]NIO26976.1 sodium/solute symporter [Candidatus Latescibacterota bacterium]NIO56053.1 sodium/solute symporter [Candidatus Latescibacterota bacterium]